jgi:hypothetical protein
MQAAIARQNMGYRYDLWHRKIQSCIFNNQNPVIALTACRRGIGLNARRISIMDRVTESVSWIKPHLFAFFGFNK